MGACFDVRCPPYWPLFREYVQSPPLLARCSENMCGVPPSRYTLFLCGVPPQFSSVPTLALSWILSKIENLASSSLQDKVYLNMYPRVWHSQLSLFIIAFTFISHLVTRYILGSNHTIKDHNFLSILQLRLHISKLHLGYPHPLGYPLLASHNTLLLGQPPCLQTDTLLNDNA